MKNKAYFFSLIIFLNIIAKAQWIDNMSIQPQNPLTTDYITLNYSAFFPATDCYLISHNVNINILNYIIVDCMHYQGQLTVICNSNQSIPIGMLPAGNYSLLLNVHIPGGTATQTLAFTVSQSVNLDETDGTQQTIIVNFNNEISQRILIPNIDYHRIQLFHSSGQLITDIPFEKELQLPKFPSGLYFVKFISDKNIFTSKVILTQ